MSSPSPKAPGLRPGDVTLSDRLSRREAVRTAIRYATLGGIGLLSGGLLVRNGTSCPQPTTCRGCAALRECHLPQAIAARRQGS